MLAFNISIMNEIKRIAGKNMLILVGYTLLIRVLCGNKNGIAIAMLSATVITLHFFIILIQGFNYRGEDGNKMSNAFFLSSGLILLVGFSTCWTNANF